ncbi:MAG TPA: hypothetical protein PKE64_26360 [Anaerolineae bacterium]|nr:hypothetical protein [Anaerolineae bacterium]
MRSHKLTLTTPARYRVCIQGRLDNTWSDEFGGMTFTNYLESGRSMVTILTGQVMNQAELMGVLNHLYGLGFPFLSVECVEIGDCITPQEKGDRK